MTVKPDAVAYPPRGLNREEAARYIGVSPRKFDQLIIDRRMPKAKRVDGRRVWDRAKLDIYFNGLDEVDEDNVIDRVLAGGSSK